MLAGWQVMLLLLVLLFVILCVSACYCRTDRLAIIRYLCSATAFAYTATFRGRHVPLLCRTLFLRLLAFALGSCAVRVLFVCTRVGLPKSRVYTVWLHGRVHLHRQRIEGICLVDGCVDALIWSCFCLFWIVRYAAHNHFEYAFL